MSTLNTKLLMALATSMVLVACKSTPIKPATVEDKSPSAPTAANTTPDAGADTNAIKEAKIDSNASGDDKNNPLKDPNNILSKRNIYFDYDSDAVKAEYRPHCRGTRQILAGAPRH